LRPSYRCGERTNYSGSKENEEGEVTAARALLRRD
jgi:hypothetical protein